MSSRTPLVTVALQFYNNERTLALAIRSVLSQSLGDFELLLHDDGSTDHSMAVAQQFRDERIQLFSDGVRLWRPARINQALDLARGEYFALMDGDDICYPDRLLHQIGYIAENPGVDLVGSSTLVFRGKGHAIGKRSTPERHEDICRSPWSGIHMAQPAFLGRTAWFRKHRYDESMLKAQDQDLLLRSYRSSTFANVPEILLGYREERIDLRKILISRKHMSRSLYREFARQGKQGLAMRAVVEQLLKGLVDCTAATTGLGYRILRHRAHPITAHEREEWDKVWALLNEPLAAELCRPGAFGDDMRDE